MTEQPSGPPAVPTCYRHLDRETYIRCARCDKPICPDCMIEAPVGYQCPDCVREAAAATPQARTLAGGKMHTDQTLITKVLVGVNVAGFVLQQALPIVRTQGPLIGFPIAVNGEWYRLLSSAFLHVSISHLFLNMLALWFVGSAIEPRLGRGRYLTVYLVSAVAGSTLSYFVDPINVPSVGASGAVFGLFGALFILALRLRFDVRGIVAIIAINVVIGFVPGLNINWRAHLGGLIAGTVLTAAMVYAPQARRTAVSIFATVAILLVCLVATTSRTATINSCFDQAGQNHLTQQCRSLFQQ